MWRRTRRRRSEERRRCTNRPQLLGSLDIPICCDVAHYVVAAVHVDILGLAGRGALGASMAVLPNGNIAVENVNRNATPLIRPPSAGGAWPT